MNKHILIINNEFPPTGAGAANASYFFAKNLVKLGHKVTVITSSFQDLPIIEEREGINIRRIKCRRKKLFESNVKEFLSFSWNAISYLKNRIPKEERAYDISICFHAIPSGIVSYTLFRKYRISYIVMLRGGDVPGFLPEKLKYQHFFSLPLNKLVWKNADYIVANSNGLKALAEKTANKINRRVYVLRNGVDTSLFSAVRAKHFDGTLRMLFVGRLYKQKGLEYLFKAVAGLPREKRERVSIELAGEGPERGALERMAARTNLHNVFFCGYLTKEEIISKFSEVDLFVLPSLYEGMPNALLEAMAGGLPALVTDIMGNRELVGNGQTGLFVPPKDPMALRGAIIMFLEQPHLLSAFREKALERAKEFDWTSVTRQLNNLICAVPRRN